jgi:hypothetical protein
MVLMTTALPAAPLASIADSCITADAVVVGKIHRGSGAVIADVTVLQIIKGQQVANTILPVQLSRSPSDQVDSGEDFTAVVFLKQEGAGWSAISPAGENAPLRHRLLPAKDATLVGDQVSGGCEDQVFAHTLAALDDGNIAWHRSPVLAWFHGFDSKAYRDQLGALSRAANPEFRAMGLEGRFALGDVAALQQLQRDVAEFGTSTLAELGLMLPTYRSPEPAGIAELGKIVGLSDAKYTPLVHGAAHCLHALHTIESLPILYGLLDSADPEVRLKAMFGFAKFVANFPIQKPEDEQSNRNITPLPGGTYTTGDGESHFPSIGSDNQDTLAFWKAWYQANFKKTH